jgi:hypothetical protein
MLFGKAVPDNMFPYILVFLLSNVGNVIAQQPGKESGFVSLSAQISCRSLNTARLTHLYDHHLFLLRFVLHTPAPGAQLLAAARLTVEMSPFGLADPWDGAVSYA